MSKRVEAVGYASAHIASAVASATFMTLGELLQRAYGLAMTPLPASALPDVDPAVLKAKLASMLPDPVDVSGLPQMPEAWRRYALERGLYPEQRLAGALQQLQAGQR